MITFIYGENNYQARQTLNRIVTDFESKSAIERYDDDTLTLDQLPDILRGASLFATRKLVVMSGVATNKIVWNDLADHLEDLPDELELVIFEEIPDKRTRTYKLLQKIATVHECRNLSEGEAVAWLIEQAKRRSLSLAPANALLIVSRIGLNQWQLHFALEKLAGFEEVNQELVQDLMEVTPQASAFALIDAALGHQPEKVQAMVNVLRVSEDAYFFFGLMASQLFQLLTLASTKKSPNEVAKELGVHPYPLQKMQSQALGLSKLDQKTIAATLADCDNLLKRSGAEPWLILEQALLKLAVSNI